MWQFGWTELHLLRVLYRVLPMYVVDAIMYLVSLVWAILHGIPEWRPPYRKFLPQETSALECSRWC